MTDTIPTAETYRGVGIHDCQPPDRIRGAVHPAIDAVLAIADPDALLDYAGRIDFPPEARLTAVRIISAMFDAATADRLTRPKIDLALARATVAGLDSRRWRSPYAYGSLLDVPPAPGEAGPVERPEPYRSMVLQGRDDADRRA
ncbi:MAG: hypothetical protein ACK4QW_09970 [Alphaproteobacteria bacterium]